MPRVSVVIPLYNKAHSILAAVSSALGQSFADLELIVVDDGSTDGSVSALSGVPDGRLTLIAQEDSGPGAARNCRRGRVSTGEG